MDIERNYDKIFCTMVANNMVVIFPWEWTVDIMYQITSILSPQYLDWMMNQYLPELKISTTDMDISLIYSGIILWKLSGVYIKLLYAFLF